tara:strand:- start:261 stop:1154 length:894 start_codon:yes stop_codon:yes gene_type:complete
MNKRKICIGSAQFGNPYGISNRSKKRVSFNELNKIFELVLYNKINYLDTAFEYNLSSSFKKINFNFNNMNIITKIPSTYFREKNFLETIEKKLKRDLKKFKIKCFYGVLIHDFINLKNKDKYKIKKTLQYLLKKKITKKIGLSIYQQKEFYNFQKIIKPNIVQGPVNLFDKSMLKNNFLNFLESQKIEFHARSIFLQGLLLMDFENLPIYFLKWRKCFDNLKTWSVKNNISIYNACLLYVYSIQNIKKIIVGFQTSDQLNEFLQFKSRKEINFNKIINLNYSEKLIKPYHWNINEKK